MKKRKGGQIELSANDYRVGNFVYTLNPDTVTLQDISGTIRLVLNTKRLMVGNLVETALNEGNTAFLENFATMAYYFNGVVPDFELWEDVTKALQDCIGRHPELYGAKKDVDDAADAAIIHDEKEFREAMESLGS